MTMILRRSASLLVLAVLGSTAAASGPAHLEGASSGKLVVDRQSTPLTYAYARAEKGFFDPSKEDIRVILSDVPLSDEALNDDSTRNHMAQDGKLHSVEVVIDAEKRPISGVLRHAAFARTQGFVSVSGMHRFEPKTFDGRFVEGKLATDRPNEFMNVSFVYEATFRAPVWRAPRTPTPGSPRSGRRTSRTATRS